jgi:hypothetical protein
MRVRRQPSNTVSRHHIMLPAIYTRPQQPKETRRRRGVGYAQGTGAASGSDETEESSGVSRTSHHPAVPQHQVPNEAAGRRLHSATGKLSEGTLKAMPEAQEKTER